MQPQKKTPDEQLWFYEMMSQEFGPVPASEIHQLIADGMLSGTDRVRLSTSQDWIKAPQISDTGSLASATAPANEQADLPNIDDFTFEATSADDDVARKSPPVRTEEPEEAEPEFYIQSLGHVLGPLTKDELVEMAISGSVTRGDAIRGGEEGSWISVEDIPALQTEILRQSSDKSVKDTKPAESNTERTQPKRTTKRARKPAKSGPRSAAPTRKRKKPKTDEFMQEIFSEVFTTDGKLRDDLKEEQSKKTAALPASATPAKPNVPSSPPPAITPNAGVSQAATAGAATQASRRAFTPSPKTKAKSGGGFQMPDGKVLGIAGGVLALVLLLAGVFTGMVSLPGMGVDSKLVLEDFSAEYVKSKNCTIDEWTEFRQKFSLPVRTIIAGLAQQAKSDPVAKKEHDTALLAFQVMLMPHDKEAERDAAFEEMKAMLASG